jgi:hypothetical protein
VYGAKANLFVSTSFISHIIDRFWAATPMLWPSCRLHMCLVAAGFSIVLLIIHFLAFAKSDHRQCIAIEQTL